MTKLGDTPKIRDMPQTPDLIGAAEAARILDVDRTTVSLWARIGKLTPAVRLPGRTGAVLFDRSDVEALLEPETTTA